jgi:hypothetical protein
MTILLTTGKETLGISGNSTRVVFSFDKITFPVRNVSTYNNISIEFYRASKI